MHPRENSRQFIQSRLRGIRPLRRIRSQAPDLFTVLLLLRHPVRLEQITEVQLRNLIENRQQQHYSHESNEQVDGRADLVQLPVLLAGIIAGNEVAKSDGGQRDEAVIKRVQQTPLSLSVGEYKTRNQQQEHAEKQH